MPGTRPGRRSRCRRRVGTEAGRKDRSRQTRRVRRRRRSGRRRRTAARPERTRRTAERTERPPRNSRSRDWTRGGGRRSAAVSDGVRIAATSAPGGRRPQAAPCAGSMPTARRQATSPSGPERRQTRYLDWRSANQLLIAQGSRAISLPTRSPEWGSARSVEGGCEGGRIAASDCRQKIAARTASGVAMVARDASGPPSAIALSTGDAEDGGEHDAGNRQPVDVRASGLNELGLRRA